MIEPKRIAVQAWVMAFATDCPIDTRAAQISVAANSRDFLRRPDDCLLDFSGARLFAQEADLCAQVGDLGDERFVRARMVAAA